MNEHLISSKEMAQFVASGYLKFEEMVPKDLSDACLEDMKNHHGYLEVGTPVRGDVAQGHAARRCVPSAAGQRAYPFVGRSESGL